MTAAGPQGVTVGTELPPLTVRFTRETLVRYAGASGDFNPIHYSDHHAVGLGLPGVIAHGMLTLGVALRLVTDWVGDPALVHSFATRFAKPVPVPDDATGTELVVTGTVAELTTTDDGARLATVAIEVGCDGERVLRAAKAEVLLP